jgi:membrane protease YdiL (CAAX protease family)
MSTGDPRPEPTPTPPPPGAFYPYPPGPQQPGPYPYYPPPPPPRPPHPNFWWSILWCVGFLIMTQVPGAIIAIVVLLVIKVLAPHLLPLDEAENIGALLRSRGMTFATAIAFAVTEGLVIFVSWFAIRLVVGRDWKRQLAVRRLAWQHLALILLAFPAMSLFSDAAYSFLRQVLHVPSISDVGLPGMKEMEKMFSDWPAVFAVLVIGFGPGLGEELWCRGFLGRGLVGTYGYAVGVIMASFFFGLIHVDPAQGSMAMLMGLWLHFVYLLTRSFLAPVLLHFLNNSLAVVLPRIPGLVAWEENSVRQPLLVVLASVNLLAAVAWALYQTRARLEDRDPTLPAWRPLWPGVECPPPGTGTVVAQPPVQASTWILVLVSFLAFAAAVGWWILKGLG